MDILEIAQRKRDLERLILGQLQAFENETGLTVDDIQLETVRYFTPHGFAVRPHAIFLVVLVP